MLLAWILCLYSTLFDCHFVQSDWVPTVDQVQIFVKNSSDAIQSNCWFEFRRLMRSGAISLYFFAFEVSNYWNLRRVTAMARPLDSACSTWPPGWPPDSVSENRLFLIHLSYSSLFSSRSFCTKLNIKIKVKIFQDYFPQMEFFWISKMSINRWKATILCLFSM